MGNKCLCWINCNQTITWMDGWMDICMHEWMYGCMCECIYVCIVWMGGCTVCIYDMYVCMYVIDGGREGGME